MLVLLLVMTSQATAPQPAAEPGAVSPTLLPSEPMALVAASPEALLTGRPGEWDAAIRERGWIVRDGDRWRMWYTGYDGSREGLKRLGHAVSRDGRSWRREPDRPISPPSVWVEDVCVVRDGDRWQMLAESPRTISRLSSSDGIDWQLEAPVEIRKVNGEPIASGPTGTPVVVRHDGQWHLFYERYDRGIWHATSTDWTTWTHVDDDPVFAPSDRGFDSAMIAFNQIVRDGSRWVAFYHGAASLEKPRLWANGAAVSNDLLRWERIDANPLTSPAANLSSLSAVRDGDRWRYFTTHARVDELRLIDD